MSIEARPIEGMGVTRRVGVTAAVVALLLYGGVTYCRPAVC